MTRARHSFTLTAALILSAPAIAQEYPTKPVMFVVPYAPGGGTEVMARLLGRRLEQRLGKPFVIENRPGAATAIGASFVAKSAPDGHTILLATSTTMAINVGIYKSLSYDPVKELTPVALVSDVPFILVVNPSLPVQTVPEFLKYAKEQTTPLSYSSPAGGGVPHFAVELIKQRYDLQLTHVPYRNSPQSILDVAAGHVNFAFAEAGASLALIRDGKLRALAVSSKQRLPAHPSVPTFAEAAGVPDFESVAWHMLVLRSGTPAPIVDRLHAEMKTIMSAPEMQQRISNMGLIPLDPPPIQETERYVRAETAKWAAVLKAIGLAGSQ